VPRPEPRIVEWHRADPWPRMRRVLVIGPTILTLGGLVIAVSFLTRQPLDVRAIATSAGFVLVIAGAAFTLASMHRILRNEVSLVLRTDGVLVQSARSETMVLWDDLRDVRWDAGAASLVLERSTGDPVVVGVAHVRIGGPELAARVLQCKRKVALNLPHLPS
jgi:hypothetical protein